MVLKEIPEKELIKILKDAGCDDAVIDTVMKTNGDKKNMIHILRQRRICILNELHPLQKELNCLDYLIYKIRKTNY